MTGGIATGSGGFVAGYYDFGQGTAHTPSANSWSLYAPALIGTAFSWVGPSAAATGFVLGTNSAGIVTLSQVGSTGSGSVVLAAAPTITGHPTIEGVTSTGATGTGNLVFATAPSITLTNASGALTNTTYDAEGTGNTITIPFTIWLPAAGCNNATAASFWDLPVSTPAVATCVTGSNTQKGVLAYADTSGGFSAQTEYLLPDDWTGAGALDAKIIWSTGATTGNAKWSLSTICTATNATETDDAAFNTASTVTTAAPGTANRLQTSTITSVTATGCAAGEFLHLKLFRDGNDGSDTIAATANLVGIELKVRRAL